MKAKKTSPKSIRFNIKDLELALAKSELESIQELVDWLLKDYVKGFSYEKPKEVISKEPIKNKLTEIINSKGTKGYYDTDELDGISRPDVYF